MPLSGDQAAVLDRRGRRGACADAAAFLEEFLADGPRPSLEVWTAARKAGHSERTVQRAKRTLDIRSQQVHKDGRNITYTLLPGQVVLTGDPDVDKMMQRLAEMEKAYPPHTPLDGDDVDFGSENDDERD